MILFTLVPVLGESDKKMDDKDNEKKYLILGSITLVGLGFGIWSIFGRKTYASLREVPLGILVAELGRRLK